MEKLRAALLSIILVVQLASVSSRPVLKIGEDVVNNDVSNSISIVNTNELKIGFDLVISCVIFLIVIDLDSIDATIGGTGRAIRTVKWIRRMRRGGEAVGV